MTTRNSRALKRWMVAAAAVAVGASALVSTSASAVNHTEPDDTRISGDNRYSTAVEVSKFNQECDVIIANGLDFPDGLAASVYGDTILLTEAGALPAETKAELVRLNADCEGIDVTIVGGTTVVSSAVFEELAVIIGYDPKRVSGLNRYLTAIEIAKDRGGSNNDTVILATGLDFPDALAAGPLSDEIDAPILLNSGTSVRSDVAAYLLNPLYEIDTVIIVGGETVIPASVEAQLKGSFGLTVERLAGSNRAGTAVAIADYIIEEWGDTNFADSVTLVNGFGANFADALAAGPFGQDFQSPILLVSKDSIPAETAKYHQDRCLTIDDIYTIGGTAVVSNAVVAGAVGAATCTAPAITSATLVNNNFKQYTATVGTLTVKAVAGSPADGAAANAWQLALIQNGTPGTEGVVVNAAGTGFGGIPTFVMTANFTDLTEQGFVNVWNASPAGALVTASTTAGPLVVVNPALVGGEVADPNVIGLATDLVGFGATLGSQNSVVTVTFARPVTEAIPSGLYPNLNPATMAANLTNSATYTTPPAAGVTTMTYTWADNQNALAIPSLPNWQIRFGTGDIEDAVTKFTNGAIVAQTLVAP